MNIAITGLYNYVTNLPWHEYFNTLKEKVCNVAKVILLALGSALLIRYAPKIFTVGFLIGLTFPDATANKIDVIWEACKKFFPIFGVALYLIPPVISFPIIAFIMSARIGAYLSQHGRDVIIAP